MTSKFPLGGRWSELYILLLMVSCNHITTVCYYFWSVILVNFAFFGDCINNIIIKRSYVYDIQVYWSYL